MTTDAVRASERFEPSDVRSVVFGYRPVMDVRSANNPISPKSFFIPPVAIPLSTRALTIMASPSRVKLRRVTASERGQKPEILLNPGQQATASLHESLIAANPAQIRLWNVHIAKNDTSIG